MLISSFYARFMLICAFYADQANYKNSAFNMLNTKCMLFHAYQRV